MTSIYDFLLADTLKKDYYADDPFYSTGRNILQIQAPAARNNTEAFLMPFLQNIIGGTLVGYGKSQAEDAAFQAAKESPYIAPFLKEQSEFIGPRSPEEMAALEANPLYKYLAEEAPENFTPEVAKLDTVQGILQKQNIEEYLQKQKERKEELGLKMAEKAFEKGLNYSDTVIQGEANLEAAKAAAKLKGESVAFGYNPKQEEEMDKLRKEFSGLPEVKNFAAVEKAGKIITQAVADDSSVADQELVRYSIQLIEPGMAVREGEQRAVASSQSIPEAWKGELTKALSGKSALGPEVREGIKRLAERAYQGNKEQYDRTLKFYQDQALTKNLDPSRISYMGESAPSLITKSIGGQTYYKVDGGWRKK